MTNTATPEQGPEKKISRKWTIRLILILVIVTLIPVMMITNPDKAHFRNWLNYHLQKPGGTLAEKLGRMSASRQLNYNITYLNRVVFSVARTKAGNEELTFVGVFGTWLPLD